ncbi:hypothetical protein [Methylobacterium currus]|uniref:hypothetical protein n=1 Tax=Methylobacterium currus TaxID=2051553 RepID=UPI0013DF28A6|nr:hypothetical protein [Methylobacterium currus]
MDNDASVLTPVEQDLARDTDAFVALRDGLRRDFASLGPAERQVFDALLVEGGL